MFLCMQYLKLEEVSEQTRLNEWQIKHRSSLLAVMFHHTTNHSEQASWNGKVDPQDAGSSCIEQEETNSRTSGSPVVDTHSAATVAGLS